MDRNKIAIIVSRGTLEGVYPALIMANGALMEGMDIILFFTFFGLDAIIKSKMSALKVATVGNPALMPSLIGIVPGVASFVTKHMKQEMEKLDIPPVDEFLEMIHDGGGKIYACKATVDMFHIKEDDFFEYFDGIVTVGQFYEMSMDGQIVFT